MASAEPLEEPSQESTRRAQPGFPSESAGVQSLFAERKSGTALGLPLRGSHAQLPEEVDGPTAVTALAPIAEARRDVAQAPRRNSELLPDQGALWGGRGGQRKHSHVDQPRTRLSESPLSAPE